jgi:hypothetical protein
MCISIASQRVLKPVTSAADLGYVWHDRVETLCTPAAAEAAAAAAAAAASVAAATTPAPMSVALVR